MTPEDPDRTEGELGPEDGETVRRLLAGAAGPRTMPDHVAARLDAVLAGLLAERDPGTTEAPNRSPAVTDLSQRRARRWPKVLVAAAAVSVIGVGLGNIVQNGGGDAMSGATSSEDSNAEAGADAGGAEVAPSPGSGDHLAPSQADGQERGALESARLLGAKAPTSALPQVRPGSATADAQRIHDQTLLGPVDPLRDDTLAGVDTNKCALPPVTPGDELVAVRLDGERATLVFRAVTDGRREAAVYPCADSSSPELLTTIDAR